MFETGWGEGRVCRENFHRADAAGDDSPDSDRFYSWGALIPAMWMLEQGDPAGYPALRSGP
jgi:putative isomerase